MSTSVTSARPATPSAVADHLRGLEDTLREQLRSMPALPPDDVAAAHRASVARTLEEVRLALRLCDEGRYGTCIRCADPISAKNNASAAATVNSIYYRRSARN